MLFTSFTFLYYFLPIVIGIYYCLPRKFKNLFLLGASLFFYAWANPAHLVILLFITFIGYSAAILSEKVHNRSVVLIGASFYILGVLIFFKYVDFTILSVNQLIDGDIPLLAVILPIGISFYTFQTISYLLDVNARQVRVEKNPLTLALFISLFPQLIAGPIIRYRQIAQQLENRHHSILKVYQGLRRFIIGLAKKVIVANTLGISVDKIFDTPLNTLTPMIAWIGVFLYALQLYYDFSGYSDMAIGLGRMLGFKFPENFNYPYISRSISEFWRRWHMSLSGWFKEYVYIPMGGNRKGNYRTLFNLMVVFLLIGIWHGAEWTFIVWGVWNGLFVIFEKIAKLVEIRMPYFISNTVGRLYVIFVSLIGWTFFRAESMTQAYDYLRLLVGILPYQQAYGLSYFIQTSGWIVAVSGCLGACGMGANLLRRHSTTRLNVITDIYLVVLLCCTVILLTASGYNPFIYFRF